MRAATWSSCVAIVVALCCPVSAEVLYDVVPLKSILPPQGGEIKLIQDLNDRGDMVGTWSRPREWGGGSSAFVYVNGQFVDLKPLAGRESSAMSINNLGQVVGNMSRKSGAQYISIPYLYHDGTFERLDALCDPGADAFAINDLGQVVGRARYGEGAPPFLYTDGLITRLPTFGGTWGEAMDINNRGQIVGDAMASDNCHAFLYADGVMHDIGALLPYDFSTANAVNEAGQVVGTYSSSYSFEWCAFLYEDGRVIDLGHLGDLEYAVANDINDAGQIVGKADSAFLWTDGTMVDLNDLIDPGLEIRFRSAEAINNHGQILCYGKDNDYYLLTPLGERQHTPAPAPALLVAGGLAALLARRCGRRR